jgi:hypothetical protein
LKHKKVYEIPLVFPEEQLIATWRISVKNGMLKVEGIEEIANPPTPPTLTDQHPETKSAVCPSRLSP